MDFVLAALASRAESSKDPLQVRLRGTLKKAANLRTATSGIRASENVDAGALKSTLNAFLALANSGNPLMGGLNNPIPLFSQACALIIKLSHSAVLGSKSKKAEAVEAVEKIYEESLDDFFNKQ